MSTDDIDIKQFILRILESPRKIQADVLKVTLGALNVSVRIELACEMILRTQYDSVWEVAYAVLCESIRMESGNDDEHTLNSLIKTTVHRLMTGDQLGEILQGFRETLILRARKHQVFEDTIDAVINELWLVTVKKLANYNPNQGSYFKWIICFQFRPAIRQVRGRSLGGAIDENATNDDVTKSGQNKSSEVDGSGKDIDSEVFWEVMRLAALCGGYPHQQLAFFLSKQILGDGAFGDPKKTAARFYGMRLELLFDYWMLSYLHQSDFKNADNREKVRVMANPIRDRLKYTVAELFRYSPDQAFCREDKTVVSGQTSLLDYGFCLEGGLEAGIQDWSGKVKKRVANLIGVKVSADQYPEGESSEKDVQLVMGQHQKRCMLRHLSPCSTNHQNCPWSNRVIIQA